MKKNVYQWQGEPVRVKFGTVEVAEVRDKPLYWYNYEVQGLGIKKLPAIQVTYKDPGGAKQVFNIANHFGIGVRKLEAGGFPNMVHLSLPAGGFTEYTAQEWEVEKLKALTEDLPAFREYEKKRDAWQQMRYPAEHREREKIFLHNPPVRLWEIK